MVCSRWVLFLSLWTGVTTALLVLGGCYGSTCDGSTVRFGRNPGEGRLVSKDIWESNRVDERWIDFPHQRTLDIDLHELGVDRLPTIILPYVSAQANPLREGGNQTLSAGNLTVITADRGRITVRNDTCADYYVRVVVQNAPEAEPTDGGPTAARSASYGTTAP